MVPKYKRRFAKLNQKVKRRSPKGLRLILKYLWLSNNPRLSLKMTKMIKVAATQSLLKSN